MISPLTLDDLTIVSAFVDGDGDPEAPNQWPAVRIHIRRPHPMIELTIDEARDLVSAIETAIDQAENPDTDEA